MASRILGPVGFGLDYHARGYAFPSFVDYDATQEFDRDLAGVAVVEAGA